LAAHGGWCCTTGRASLRSEDTGLAGIGVVGSLATIDGPGTRVSTTPELQEPIDGRTARAVRTRDAIVDACVALVDEGDLRPTGPRIAERAGVSVRSVFQHFDDLESLFTAVGERVTQRVSTIVGEIDATLPTDERVRVFVAQRARLLEAISPVLRAALIHAHGSPSITSQFQHGHDLFRRQVAAVFAVELAVAPEPDLLRDALVTTMSWATWDTLRARQDRSCDRAEQAMAWMVHAALGAGVRS
jgi:TetR/AcrR family transcriptional regulator of autoinduction and epiphytic fitness